MKTRSIPFFALALLFSLAFTGRALADDDVQLGVYLEELNDESSAEYDYEGDGVLITDIIEGSGADNAGLKAGEIIVVFNGEMIASVSDLINAIRETSVGDEVKVIVISEGKTKKYNVVMGSKKAEKPPKEPKPPKKAKELKDVEKAQKEFLEEFLKGRKKGETPDVEKWMYVYPGQRPWLGISMLELTEQLARFFEVKGGVLVSQVVEGSPAEKAGLKAGDVIVAMGEIKIKAGDGLLDALSKHEEGDKVPVTYSRRGEKHTAKVKLGKRQDAEFGAESYLFSDKDGKYEIVKPQIPPLPPVPEVDMKEFKKGMEKYKVEMEKLREEMKRLKEELKKMKKDRD